MIQPSDSNPEASSAGAVESFDEPLDEFESPLAPDDEYDHPAPSIEDDLAWQHTLADSVVIEGLGLFLGEPVTCTIRPAPADHGIVFERIDLDDPVRIPASVANVTNRSRRTTLKLGSVTVETCEHCLSALAGLRVDNALVQLDGPELPCGDGSAKPYVDAILSVGLTRQDAERRYHRITEPITVEEGDSMLAALPSEQSDFQVLYDLDYGDESPLPRQLHSFRMGSDGAYAEQIAPCRTFSMLEEAKALWDRGLCQHLSPQDVLVIGDDGPVENTYRFENEPVRHKILDIIGDLYLIGRPIQGRIVAYRSGHSLNHQLANRLLEQIQTKERTAAARKRSMDIQQILRLMRHRYPMLLVDRVVEIEGDRRAIGIKNVSINEPFFQGHYPGTPIMPGVLVVEAMAQLSGLLLSRVLQHTGKIAILLSLDRVKLRRPVVPGDQLVMEAESIRAQARTANVKCRAFVDDQLVAEAQIRFIMVDADQE
ncbi:MAG: UDP-3-O-acyl-N-acetylglucosamine deacetylase [Phycisphaerales bacterium]